MDPFNARLECGQLLCMCMNVHGYTQYVAVILRLSITACGIYKHVQCNIVQTVIAVYVAAVYSIYCTVHMITVILIHLYKQRNWKEF